MEAVSTPNAPAAIGPYSQGMKAGNLVFCSGQIPVDPATGNIPAGISAQAEQSCKNVAAVLEAAGSSLASVVKTTCFLADMADFAAFNQVYVAYFVSKPARSCCAVKELPKGVLCEIEAVALVSRYNYSRRFFRRLNFICVYRGSLMSHTFCKGHGLPFPRAAGSPGCIFPHGKCELWRLPAFRRLPPRRPPGQARSS